MRNAAALRCRARVCAAPPSLPLPQSPPLSSRVASCALQRRRRRKDESSSSSGGGGEGRDEAAGPPARSDAAGDGAAAAAAATAAAPPPQAAALAVATTTSSGSDSGAALEASTSSSDSGGGAYMLDPDDAAWTWDDDYNPAALARAADAARRPPPSARALLHAARAAAAAAAPPTVITRIPQDLSRDAIANGVVLIDKPPDWTTLDATRAVRYALKADRAAYAGALDDMATGLVVVCLGAAARAAAPRFAPLPRTYSGSLRLGISTDTFDLGRGATVLEELPWHHVTDDDVARAAAALIGEVLLEPHLLSGAKAGGKALRWYAERRRAPQGAAAGAGAPPARAARVLEFSVWRLPAVAAAGGGGGGGEGPAGSSSSNSGSVSGVSASPSPDVGFRIVAAKGASIRGLVDALGRTLGCGAALASLRREAIGGFSVDSAWPLDVLLPAARKFQKGGWRSGPPPAGHGGGALGGGGGGAFGALGGGGGGADERARLLGGGGGGG